MLNSEDVYIVHKFDMKRIVPGSVVLVLGARGTGKTTVIVDLLHHMRGYKLGAIMVDTLDTAAKYAEHVPDSLIYSQYDASVVEKLIRQQEKQILEAKRRHDYPIEVKSPKFLVLDDLAFNKSIQKDEVLRRVYTNGRHFKLTTIIAAQYCMQVPKECRLMFDYIFTTYEKTNKYRQQIYEEFDVGFPDEPTMHAIMQKCTTEYSVMVLDKRSTGLLGLSDSVFHYKAQFDRKFRLDSPTLWRLHFKHFNRMYSDFGATATISSGRGTKKRQIRVRRVAKIKTTNNNNTNR